MGLLRRRHQVVPTRARRLRTVALALVCLALCSGAATAPPLRVATSGDYPPFSRQVPGTPHFAPSPTPYEGFDIEVARAFAHAQERRLHWVPMHWPELLAQLQRDEADLVMSGVTVRAERSLGGRFSVPVAQSGAVVLVATKSRFRDVVDLNLPGVRVAVNRGGHLERVARQLLPEANLLTLPDNTAVKMALLDRSVDAVVTDTLEAPRWLRLSDSRAIGPLTRDIKAYLVRSDLSDLSVALDVWLLQAEADGTLAKLRQKWLGADSPITATPISALAAAIDERLALMPLVAVAKAHDGKAVPDPEREFVVVQAAVAAALKWMPQQAQHDATAQHVQALFVALIEAAKDIQLQHVKASLQPEHSHATQDPNFDLETDLRPALLRIGERIAMLLPRVEESVTQELCQEQLAVFPASGNLQETRLEEICKAIRAIAAVATAP